MAEPVIERVIGGLWSIPVPIPDNPLGHTNVYLFETDRGPVIVDAGWHDDTSWDMLEAGFRAAGYEVADAYGVLVTHMHSDHHGLSGRVRDSSGAWVALHPDDAAMIQRVQSNTTDYRDELALVLLEAGAPEHEVSAPGRQAHRPGSHRGPRGPLAPPDRLLADGELTDVPGWRVEAVWTPGHSPGHTCFRVPDHGLLLAGDHVLPTITPHIALSRRNRAGDPLGEFLTSLSKVDQPDVRQVLPAHQHRFADLHRRVVEIAEHHRRHLDALVLHLSAGPATLWELAAGLVWNRPWDELTLHMKRAAVNETAAHLRHLTVHHRVQRQRGVRPYTFETVAA
jgi:glyoxylase-like metal-dependent hydrolase (beta-lactamase superfamily II)